MFALRGPQDLRRMLSTPRVNIFGFFGAELLVHSILFVFLWLLLTSVLYKHLWGGNWGPGPDGDECDRARGRGPGWSSWCTVGDQHAFMQVLYIGSRCWLLVKDLQRKAPGREEAPCLPSQLRDLGPKLLHAPPGKWEGVECEIPSRFNTLWLYGLSWRFDLMPRVI